MENILIVDTDSIPEIYEIKEDTQLLFADPKINNDGIYWQIVRANRRTLYNYMSRGPMSNADQKYVNFLLEKIDNQQDVINQLNQTVLNLQGQLLAMGNRVTGVENIVDELEQETIGLSRGQNSIFFVNRYDYLYNTVKSLIKDCVCLFFETLPAINYSSIELPQYNNQETIQFLNFVPVHFNLQDELSGNAIYGLGFNANGISKLTQPVIIDNTVLIESPSDLSNINLGTLSVPRMSTYKLLKNSSEINPFGFGRLDINAFASRNLSIQRFQFTMMVGFKMQDFNNYATGNSKIICCCTMDNDVESLYTTDEAGMFFYVSSTHPNIKRITFSVRAVKGGKLYTKYMDVNFPSGYSATDFVIFSISYDYDVKRGIPLIVTFNSYNTYDKMFSHGESNMGVLPKDSVVFSGGFSKFVGNDLTRLIVPGGKDGADLTITHFGLFDCAMSESEMRTILKVLFNADL